jgi:thiosulfate/3-mercaptopyruvate sulfurtransferase
MTERVPFRRIGLAEAQVVLAREGVAILDVRAPDTFHAGHIEGARHVSMADLGPVMASTPKTAPVLIYCYRGNASQEYAQIFSDFRYLEVYSLDGGYEAWGKR